MRRVRGVSLVELLIMLIVGSCVLALAFQGISILKTGYESTFNTNTANADARKAIIAITDHLRNAQRCAATSGCVSDSVLGAASSTSISYYGDTTGTSVTYFLSGTNLIRRDGATDNTVISDVTSLAMSYYKCATYNGTWTSVANPTTSDLSQICGIRIVVTCTQSGVPFTLETTTRLRNSPKKGPLMGY